MSEKTDAHSGGIWSVAFSPDGTSKIVSGSPDGTIKVWDWGKLELLSEKSNALPISLELCAFSPDGTKFVSGADAST
jgi:WD40 repeat protein